MAVPNELTGDDERVTRAWLNELRAEVADLATQLAGSGTADELKASSSETLKIETASGVFVTAVAGGAAAGADGPPGFYIKYGEHSSIDTSDINDFDAWWPFTDKRNAPLTA